MYFASSRVTDFARALSLVLVLVTIASADLVRELEELERARPYLTPEEYRAAKAKILERINDPDKQREELDEQYIRGEMFNRGQQILNDRYRAMNSTHPGLRFP